MAATSERRRVPADRDLSGPLIAAALGGPLAYLVLAKAGDAIGLAPGSFSADVLRLLPVALVSLQLASLASEVRAARALRRERIRARRARAARRRATRVEGERRQAQDADIRRMRSAFLDCLTHEVRTPMDGILGMIELALATDVDDDQRQLLSTARASTHTLLDVVDGVVEFERLAVGAARPVRRPLDLEQLLTTCAGQLVRRGLAPGLLPTFHLDPELPRARLGDADRLLRLLTAAAGRMAVQARSATLWIDVSSGGHPDELLVSVSDGGRRPDPEHPVEPLEPFAESALGGGLAVELGVATTLAASMQGSLGLRRDDDGQEEIVLRVRCDRRPGVDRTVPRRCPAPVVLVDGDLYGREALATNLGELGARVWQAESARQALDVLDSLDGEAPLVLVDGRLEDADALFAAWHRDHAAAGGRLVRLLPPGTVAAGPGEVNRPLLPRALEAVLRGPAHAPDPDAASPAHAHAHRVAEPTEPSPTRGPSPSLRLLLAEDNPVSRQVAQRMLSAWGHSVWLAETGRDALEISSEQHIDAVLMDVSMPVMDGLEATRRIRRREVGSATHLPIVAMTAHAGADDRRRCLDAGMDDFVTKPVRAADLRAVLDRLPAQSASRSITWSTSKSS